MRCPGYLCPELEWIFRVSGGSVFSEDAGFKLLLGQVDEFPLMQVLARQLGELFFKQIQILRLTM